LISVTWAFPDCDGRTERIKRQQYEDWGKRSTEVQIEIADGGQRDP
jgi:hypothetical protein